VLLWIQNTVIRVSRAQRSVDSSPGLIAVFHALLRLLAPRHPPHALSSLAALILSSQGDVLGHWSLVISKDRKDLHCRLRPPTADQDQHPLLLVAISLQPSAINQDLTGLCQ
jgi:hypothetical protein